jgi:type I restriction enzyme S subunit
MNNLKKFNLVDDLGFVKTGVNKFKNTKKYYSTGSIKGKIFTYEGEYTYENRPSRANREVKEGDVLQARMMNTNKIILVDKKLDGSLFSTGFFQFRPPKELIITKFLYYYLSSKYFLDKKDNLSGGATQKAINDSSLKQIKILLPSLSKQRIIVSEIDVLFAEIDKHKKLDEAKLEKNESLIQNFIDKIFTNNKNLHKLSDCTQINPPKREVNNLDNATEVSFMPMKDLLINNKLAIPNQKRKLKDVKGAYVYFSERDILLAKITPCFENGKIGIATNLLNGIGFGSSEYIVFRPNKNLINDWLYYFLNRNSFRLDGAQNMSGAVGHKRVNKDFIDNTLIPIPSIEEQKKIIFTLKNLSTYSKTINEIILKKKNQLNLLKNSILKKLLNNNLLV